MKQKRFQYFLSGRQRRFSEKNLEKIEFMRFKVYRPKKMAENIKNFLNAKGDKAYFILCEKPYIKPYNDLRKIHKKHKVLGLEINHLKNNEYQINIKFI